MLVSSALCLAARGGDATVRPCARLCPTGAIRVEPPESAMPGPHIDPARCDGCGLCVRACPTGVFADSSEQREGAGAVVRRAVVAGRDLHLCCARAARMFGCASHDVAADCARAEVSCLGVVGEAALLLAVTLGARSVRLDNRACTGCARRRGLVLARQAVGRATRLAQWMGRSSKVAFVCPPGGAPVPSCDAGRRAFLRLGSVVPRRTPAPAYSAALHRVPADRRLLAECLRTAATAPSPPLRPGALGIWGVSIAADCNVCGACAALCPTGSLALHEDDTGATLIHEPLLCSGCRLCTSRCPRTALRAADAIPSEWRRGPRLTLAFAPRRSCPDCRQPFQARAAEPSGAWCPDCRFRRALVASLRARPVEVTT